MTRLLQLASARRNARDDIARLVADYKFRVELARQAQQFIEDLLIVTVTVMCSLAIVL